MTFAQSVRRGEQELARGEISIACVDRSGVKPRRIPKEMKDRLGPVQ